MATFAVGDKIAVSRKPKNGEPLDDYWIPEMDNYLGSEGEIINIDYDTPYSPIGSLGSPSAGAPVQCCEVQHPDGSVYTYPYYCLSKKAAPSPVFQCTCKTELLITRGCKCGAMSKEKAISKK